MSELADVDDAQLLDMEGRAILGREHLAQLRMLAEMRRRVETRIAAAAYLAVMDGEGSWSDVGAALGVSKQAAQQRYGKNPSGMTAEAARGWPQEIRKRADELAARSHKSHRSA